MNQVGLESDATEESQNGLKAAGNVGQSKSTDKNKLVQKFTEKCDVLISFMERF